MCQSEVTEFFLELTEFAAEFSLLKQSEKKKTVFRPFPKFRAAGKSGKNFPAASKFAGKPFSKEVWTATAFSSFLKLPVKGQISETSETPEPLRNTANGVFQRKNLWIFYPAGC